MITTGVGPSGVNYSNESMMVRLSDQCSADRLLTLTVILLASISSTRRVHHSSQMHTYAVSPRVEFLASLPDGLVGYTLPFCNTLAAQKPPAGSTEPVHAPIPPIPYYTALNRTSRAGLRTVRVILNAG